MKKLLLLVSLVFSACFCDCFRQITKLTKQIIRNGRLCPDHVRKKQLQLLKILKEVKITDDIPNNVLQAVVDALHKGNHFPLLSENIRLIDEALDAFTYKSRIPQFRRTLLVALRNIQNGNYAKGFLYEIECAITTQKNGSTRIIRFETPFKSPYGLRRRFDLVTKDKDGQICACECKNIRWDSLRGHSRKVKRQLLEQKEIIDSQKYPIIYRFYSKQPIPEKWKDWLDYYGIDSVEAR